MSGCICGGKFSMCEDGHAVNCPASNQHAAYQRMTAEREAFESVDYAEAARVMFEACRDRFMRPEQCYAAVAALTAAGFITTPPARSYADGVRDSAKVAEKRFEFETSGLPDRCFDSQALARRNGGRIIAAAIRLLSQGGKA